MFGSLSAFTVVGTLLASRASKRWGRLQVVIPCLTGGVAATMILGLARDYYTTASVMMPLFIARCTLMWSVMALQGSIVADYTPKSQRGRWKALNSITGMGWSGSAAVGGWLIDRWGYGVCFTITAAFQFLCI